MSRRFLLATVVALSLAGCSAGAAAPTTSAPTVPPSVQAPTPQPTVTIDPAIPAARAHVLNTIDLLQAQADAITSGSAIDDTSSVYAAVQVVALTSRQDEDWFNTQPTSVQLYPAFAEYDRDLMSVATLSQATVTGFYTDAGATVAGEAGRALGALLALRPTVSLVH